MSKRSIRCIARITVLIIVTLAVAGCNRSLETVNVHVERADGTLFQDVSVTDLGRRPAESEARVVPLEANGGKPFRYRIEASGDTPIQMDGTDPRIIIGVSGDVAGGEVLVHSGDRAQRYSFSRTVQDLRTRPADRYQLSFPLDRLREAPWEVEFVAASGSGGFTVEEIRFGYRAPEIVTVRSEAVSVDTVFPVQLNDSSITLPTLGGVIRDHTDALLLEYHADRSLFHDRTDRPTAAIVIQGEAGREQRLEMRLRPGERTLAIRPGYWIRDAVSFTLETPEGFDLRRIRTVPIPSDPDEPIAMELEELQSWPRELWRRQDFELFFWSAYPRILWVDHRTYGTQARMFKRLAFFVEKRGYQGRLLTNAELQNRHGWNAHNYRPEGLSAFFNAVEANNFQLNEEEETLREIVAARGLLVRDETRPPGERWLPGSGGILSISQDSFPSLRRLLTVHEAMHGVFYEEPAFRRRAFDYWDQEMSQRERDFWQVFFAWASYDPEDRYLMVNEFQAYLLQQGEQSANWYFGTRTADRLRTAQPHRAESIDLLLRDYPDTFIRAAAAVNESLFEVAGMVGGDPFCLRLVEP